MISNLIKSKEDNDKIKDFKKLYANVNKGLNYLKSDGAIKRPANEILGEAEKPVKNNPFNFNEKYKAKRVLINTKKVGENPNNVVITKSDEYTIHNLIR